MVTHIRRTLYRLSLTLVVLLALAACGAQGGAPAVAPEPAAPVESPEDRVKSFFATFSDAISDPQISDAARRDEWVTRLTAYAAPNDQADARTSIESALGEFGGLNIAEMVGQPELDVRMDVRFTITETRLVEESGDRATVEVVNGTIAMQPVGEDVAELGPLADQFTMELPISDFFSDTSDGSNQIQLQRIDGVWYLIDALG
jgi:hypothetical protein